MSSALDHKNATTTAPAAGARGAAAAVLRMRELPVLIALVAVAIGEAVDRSLAERTIKLPQDDRAATRD